MLCRKQIDMTTRTHQLGPSWKHNSSLIDTAFMFDCDSTIGTELHFWLVWKWPLCGPKFLNGPSHCHQNQSPTYFCGMALCGTISKIHFLLLKLSYGNQVNACFWSILALNYIYGFSHNSQNNFKPSFGGVTPCGAISKRFISYINFLQSI